jgi:hypothetical protein
MLSVWRYRILIPTYFNVFLEKSWKVWHAGVQPKRFFDNSFKVFHLIQVRHCGRAVRTFKNLLLFFICLILERVSSYISVFRAFLVSVSLHKVRSINFKTLHGRKRQFTVSSGRWWNPSNESCGKYMKYGWRHFVRLNKPTGGSFSVIILALPGRDAHPSPPSIAEVKNRVELYLYSP